MWWSWKEWYWTISTLRGLDGLESTHFQQFTNWADVVVLKEQTFFLLFPLLEGVVVMKVLIFNNFHFRRMCWSWKDSFVSISTLGRCGGLERTTFLTVFTFRGCGNIGRTDFWQVTGFWIISTLGGNGGFMRTEFGQFAFWEGVVVFKGLIFKISNLAGFCGLWRTDFKQFPL